MQVTFISLQQLTKQTRQMSSINEIFEHHASCRTYAVLFRHMFPDLSHVPDPEDDNIC